MVVISNLDISDNVDVSQALRNNFKGVSNKEYIQDSIQYHYKAGLITEKQARALAVEFLW